MNELLQQIDQIDQSVNDAEINVLESLIQSYDKALMILENYEGEDIYGFDIFQEGEKWDKFKEDSKAPVLGNKGESLIKRIAMIIPRLIQKLIAMIQKLFRKNKNFNQQMEKDVKDLERAVSSDNKVDTTKNTGNSDDVKKINDLSEVTIFIANDKLFAYNDSVEGGFYAKFRRFKLDDAIIKGEYTPKSIEDAIRKAKLQTSNMEGEMRELSINVGDEIQTSPGKWERADRVGDDYKIKYTDALEYMKNMQLRFGEIVDKIDADCVKIYNEVIPAIKQKRDDILKEGSTSEDSEILKLLNDYLTAMIALSNVLNSYDSLLYRTWNVHRDAMKNGLESIQGVMSSVDPQNKEHTIYVDK